MSTRAQALHASPWLGAFYVTGGGSGLLSEMLSTPGASATVLEATVPYAEDALADVLGKAPKQATSSLTARELAMAAYERAQQLGSGRLFGFGLTAALATNREKKGKHRAHWAIQTAHSTSVYSAEFAADRSSEEHQLLEYVWQSIENRLLNNLASNDAHFHEDHFAANDKLAPLLGIAPYRYSATPGHDQLIFPGSFNPIHQGHQQMMAAAESQTKLAGAYEIAVRNADKHSLDFMTLDARIQNLAGSPVWLTNTPFFADKALLFPNCTFVVGTDTMRRIGDLKYYHHRADLLEEALKVFVKQNTSFIVFGRKSGDDFVTLDDLDLPVELIRRCDGVDEAAYRNDISSTELRLNQLDNASN